MNGTMTESSRLFSLLNATVFSLLTSAQCPMGNVYLDTQAEVDEFGANYPNCTELPGALYIDGPDITDLYAFNGITHIEGTLQLTNLSLTDITAFNNLSAVGGELWISQCNSLTSLTGFTTLDTVGQALRFWQNSAMVVLDAFPDLDVCEMSLWIGENVSLTNIHGFGELDSVGMLSITENTVLTDLGAFDQAIEIGNFVELVHNEALSICNVQALCDFGLLTNYMQDGVNANALGCQYWSQVHASCISMSMVKNSLPSIALYPDPTNGTLYVDGIPRNGTPASITDHLGRLVQWIMISNGTLDVRALEPGMYVLRLAVDGRPEQFRFVRE